MPIPPPPRQRRTRRIGKTAMAASRPPWTGETGREAQAPDPAEGNAAAQQPVGSAQAVESSAMAEGPADDAASADAGSDAMLLSADVDAVCEVDGYRVSARHTGTTDADAKQYVEIDIRIPATAASR